MNNKQLVTLLHEKERLQIKNKAIQTELSHLAHQRTVIHLTYSKLEVERTKICARMRDIDGMINGAKRDSA